MRGSSRTPIPDHWIGVVKDWPDLCQSFGEALVTLSPSNLSKHAWIVGSSGSGKSTLMYSLIAAFIVRGVSLVILDPRSDFALSTIELAARARVDPDQVKFFNLREKVNPVGFNPLYVKPGDEPSYSALAFIDALAAYGEWGPQVYEYSTNAALLVAEAGGTLLDFEPLFYVASKRRALIARAKSERLRSFWNRYDGMTVDRQGPLASQVLNKMSVLVATQGQRRLFGHPSPVNLADQLDTPGSITAIALAADETGRAGWMTGSMMLSAICREVFSRVTRPESKRNPVFLFVDEFEHFSMSSFESILAEGRKCKFSAILAHQNLAQLNAKTRSAILNNVGTKIVFRTSYQDAEILNRDLAGVKGAFDIANLPVGEAVLWRSGEYPIQIEVNAPIIDDVGSQSPEAREYLQLLSELAPAYYEIVDDSPVSGSGHAYEETADSQQSSVKAEPKVTRNRKPQSGNLEDWLK